MAATQGPYLSAQSLLVIGKETNHGTGVTPNISIPIDANPSLKPNLVWAPTESLKGSPVQVYNEVPLNRHDEFSFGGNVFADTFPHLMMGLLGGTDTVTGTVAPYTHSIPLFNSASNGSQPASYTGIDLDRIQQGPADVGKLWTGGQLDTVSLTFAATGALKYKAKYLTNPFVETGLPTFNFSTEIFLPAYNGALRIDGSQTFRIIDGSLVIKRQTQPIFTVGQQGPFRIWAGPIDITGKITFLAVKTTQAMTEGLIYQHHRFSFTWTDPVSLHSINFSMTSVQIMNPVVDRGKTYVTVTCTFHALANATQAVTGYSPLTFATTNAQLSPY